MLVREQVEHTDGLAQRALVEHEIGEILPLPPPICPPNDSRASPVLGVGPFCHDLFDRDARSERLVEATERHPEPAGSVEQPEGVLAARAEEEFFALLTDLSRKRVPELVTDALVEGIAKLMNLVHRFPGGLCSHQLLFGCAQSGWEMLSSRHIQCNTKTVNRQPNRLTTDYFG